MMCSVSTWLMINSHQSVVIGPFSGAWKECLTGVKYTNKSITNKQLLSYVVATFLVLFLALANSCISAML